MPGFHIILNFFLRTQLAPSYTLSIHIDPGSWRVDFHEMSKIMKCQKSLNLGDSISPSPLLILSSVLKYILRTQRLDRYKSGFMNKVSFPWDLWPITATEIVKKTSWKTILRHLNMKKLLIYKPDDLNLICNHSQISNLGIL